MVDLVIEHTATFFSVLIGALVTFITAKIYYLKASKDLLNEAKELRRLNRLTLRAMEEAGLCQLNKDKDGNIRGLIISLSGKFTATSSLKSKAGHSVSSGAPEKS